MNNKTVYDLLLESAESLASNHSINIFDAKKPSSGMDLLRNESALSEFAMNLIESEDGLTSQEKAGFVVYAQNSAKMFLQEATLSQDIQPFASFQMVLLKEMYARQIGRRLVTTEVLPTPEETVGTFKTVLVDAAGTEHELTDIDANTTISDGWHTVSVTVPAGATDLFDNAVMTDAEEAVKTKVLDMGTRITSVTLEYKNKADAVVGNTVIPLSLYFGEDGAIAKKISFTHTDGKVTEDHLFGMIDYKTGKISISSALAKVKAVAVKWRLSNSLAEINDYEIQLKYVKEKVTLDDGELFNVGIPLNYLSDVQAFFEVDGMSKAVEQIASAINVLDDRKILREVKDAVVGDASRTQTFDYALPATGVSRVEHNKNLLEAINKSIAISDNNTQFKTISEYNIACNPIDASVITSPVLLENRNMSNVSITSASLNYNAVPMVSPAGLINILSSKLNAKGSMFIVPKGVSKEERIIGKFKYSSIIFRNNEYRSSKNPNIRNIAARHREKINVFEPKAITMVAITNN